MRIALVSVSDQLGGSEAVLLQLAAQLGRACPTWELHTIVPGEGPLGPRMAALGSAVHVLPMPPALAALGEWASAGRATDLVRQAAGALRTLPGYERRLSAVMGEIAPDILHSNGFKAHVLAARVATSAARVWHVHEYLSRRQATRRLLRRYAPLPQAVVANSNSVGGDLRRALADRLRGDLHVIHNGVDVERFTPRGPVADIDTACGLPPARPGTIRVGLAATFARWKGHDVFLRALAALPPAVPVRGYIIGGPVYDTAGSQWSLPELRAAAEAAGVAGRVGFAGFQEDMPAFMRALDVVVHASTEPEPFGLVLAEAMACARPVISTGAGGAAEIVSAGITALPCEPGDPMSLAGAIETLACKSHMRARFGAAGRQVVETRFTATRFGEAFVNLYASLHAPSPA